MSIFNINIAILGTVSSGKSTLLNSLFLEEFTSMNISRNTMIPQIYRELMNNKSKVIKDAKKEKGFDTVVDEDSSTVEPGKYVIDEFLSAYYLVGGIEYTFKAGDSSVKQKLKLLRREWPSRINNINPDTVK
jgi:GTPase SAR1 family protein